MPGITDSETTAPPVVPRVSRWIGPLFFVAGLGLVPWTAYLVLTLPTRHVQARFYDLAWGGFDVGLALLFLATGVGLLRRRMWVQSTATAAATMLVCDAWFDVLSAGDSRERMVAIAFAVGAELPSALVCFLVARHVEEVAERAQRYALVARRLRRRRRSGEEAHGVALDPELDLVQFAE